MRVRLFSRSIFPPCLHDLRRVPEEDVRQARTDGEVGSEVVDGVGRRVPGDTDRFEKSFVERIVGIENEHLISSAVSIVSLNGDIMRGSVVSTRGEERKGGRTNLVVFRSVFEEEQLREEREGLSLSLVRRVS